MDYSIIIPYRDRKSHLDILIPALHDHFKDKNYEIVIAEQIDSSKFRKAMINNIASRYAKGKYLIFHDVDHLPEHSDVDYFRIERDKLNVWYPVYRVVYVQENQDKLVFRPEHDIPSGYRTHKDRVHDDHFGGVFCCTRGAFDAINGFNSCFVGWGYEDSDIRNRFTRVYGEIPRAKKGTFYALYHTDSNPGINDIDFQRNQKLAIYGSISYKDIDTKLREGMGELSLTHIDPSITAYKETNIYQQYNARCIEIDTSKIAIDGEDIGVKELSKFLEITPEKLEKYESKTI